LRARGAGAGVVGAAAWAAALRRLAECARRFFFFLAFIRIAPMAFAFQF
jgi:hypothetical protein